MIDQLEMIWRETTLELSSPEFYIQIGVVAIAFVVGWFIAAAIVKRVSAFRNEPEPGVLFGLRLALHRSGVLVLPVSIAISLDLAAIIIADVTGTAWLVKGAQGVAFIFVAYSLTKHLMKNETLIFLLKWVGLPIALLYSVGWLDDVIPRLDGMTLELGNIQVSLYEVLRTFLFGFVLFWLGRLSNDTGKRVIRAQENLERGTREVIAKLFEIGLFVLFFLLLLNVMGVNLISLAVFGGALGVGLGFGLQQIASNFISGIIILLDRSLTIGDFIQLEDGRKGKLRELNMRSATLETFDGKDIMVPNEKFITTTFTNWTHDNKLQRYPINFQVAYKTDLEKMFPILPEVIASHPQVLSGDELPKELRPDAEIAKFGDSGIDILVEFCMEGIDDGKNRVAADLLLMIWTELKANGFQISFPQREVSLRQED